jgi:hypothetical protein
MERLPGGLSFWLLRPCGNCLARPELPGAKPSLERMAASLISRTAATSAGTISSMAERVTTSRNRRGNAGINRSNTSTTSRPATVSSAGIPAERSCANFSPVSSNEVSGHLRFRSTATARQSVRASAVDHPPQPVSAALAAQQGTFPGWCPRHRDGCAVRNRRSGRRAWRAAGRRVPVGPLPFVPAPWPHSRSPVATRTPSDIKNELDALLFRFFFGETRIRQNPTKTGSGSS